MEEYGVTGFYIFITSINFVTFDIVWSSEYTPFGSLALEEGKYGFRKAKKFTGKDLNDDTGLYYYNARWYDAGIGRFTSADTAEESSELESIRLYS